jgi:hypothetical protein
MLTATMCMLSIVPRGRLRLLAFITALKRDGIEQQAYVSIEGERLR